jgi:hypothetical protein
MPQEIPIMLLILTVGTTLGSIVWMGLNARKASMLVKARTELQTKLLDRIGSGHELAEFSQTEGGQRFIQALSMEPGESRMAKGKPVDRILGSIQKGVILALLGLGFLFLSWRYQMLDPGAFFFTVVGVIGLSLGIGFLGSAGVSYRLSKRFGLISEGEASKSSELFSQP